MVTPTRLCLVETDWLEAELGAPDLVILDASWHFPVEQRNARAEFEAGHIPGAVFFDIDEIADTDSPLPHMLPETEAFAAHMHRLGIGDGARIVAYDTKGMFSAPRAWWMMKVMGVADAAVLNGGLPKWTAEGRPLEDRTSARPQGPFTARRDGERVRGRAEMERIAAGSPAQIVDARSAERFVGQAPEPRAGLRGGHIPGSLNLHYELLLNPDGTLKADEELRAAFRDSGVNLDEPIVTTCGSGVTAAILALALEKLGHDRTAVYDGSWCEWGGDPYLPVATKR